MVKLLRSEPETDALDRFLQGQPLRVSSEILRVELACVCYRQEIGIEEAEELIAGIRLVQLRSELLISACEPFSPHQRALDAIHLATALELPLDCFVTYDGDQAEAAQAHGLTVVRPE